MAHGAARATRSANRVAFLPYPNTAGKVDVAYLIGDGLAPLWRSHVVERLGRSADRSAINIAAAPEAPPAVRALVGQLEVVHTRIRF